MTETQSATEVSEHVFLAPGLLSTSKAADFCYLCAQTHMDFYENGTTCVCKSQARGPPSNRKLGVAEVFAGRISPLPFRVGPCGPRRCGEPGPPSCPSLPAVSPPVMWTDSFLIGYLMEIFDKHS